MNIDQINHMSLDQFEQTFCEIYEHSSWVATKCFDLKPFKDISFLHLAMKNIVDSCNDSEKLSLLNAHPLLSGKSAQEGKLTAASTSEQKSAKLDQLTELELEEITSLNQQYLKKFGFPFIIAVKKLEKEDIFQAFRKRINHEKEIEFNESIAQVHLIALIRLEQLIEL